MKRLMIVSMLSAPVSLLHTMQQAPKSVIGKPKSGTIDPQELKGLPVIAEKGYLDTLPNETKVQILKEIADSFDLNEAIRNIRSLIRVNKSFSRLVNDARVTRDLIDLLTHRFGGSKDSRGRERFWKYHPFTAKKLSTGGSEEYLKQQPSSLNKWRDVKTVEQAQALVSQGIDPRFVDEFGINSIRKIVDQIPSAQHIDAIVTYLITKGAWIDTIDNYGYTLLIHAIRNERYTIASLLIPRLSSNVINWSNRFDNHRDLGFVIDHAAELQYPNDYSSALLAAASKEWVAGVVLLLDHGADKTAVSNAFMREYEKRTAKSTKAQEIVALLKKKTE